MKQQLKVIVSNRLLFSYRRAVEWLRGIHLSLFKFFVDDIAATCQLRVPQRLPRRAGLKILEKYKVVKELGRGAFGAALLVTRRSDDKNFVMKKIDLVNMPPQEKTAELEVKVLKNLQHHNIVKYIESGFEENQHSGNNRFRTSHLLIVMEFANGGDLSALVAKQKKLYREIF